MTRTRILAILAALVTAVFLSGCSNTSSTEANDGHADHSHDTETAVVSGEPAAFNDEDIAFATNMIPHHQQALELSAMVPERTTNAELLTLATQISAAQQPEIDTMKAFLVQWNQGEEAEDPHAGHGGGHGDMAGMVDDETMTKLKTLSGPEFDTLWLQSMIAHHEGAVEMAKTELAKGDSADAKTLAQNIIDTQQAEIAQMQKMLGNP